MSRIRFHNVSRTFKRGGADFLALGNVSFEVGEKEFVAIVGPSGCGKTTLLRMVAGLDFPSSGTVTVGEHQVSGPGPERAVVFQQFALFPWKTVRENIGFGLECRNVPEPVRQETVQRYIALMSLQAAENAYPHQLSGGMQQRVAIARSYAVDPKVLLMDEPFGALDAQTRVVMQEELVRVSRHNPRTVVFITHSVEEAVYLADRVVVLAAHPGRVDEIVDIATVRRTEGWDRFEHIEEVMDQESFVHLRTAIWKRLRANEADVATH